MFMLKDQKVVMVVKEVMEDRAATAPQEYTTNLNPPLELLMITQLVPKVDLADLVDQEDRKDL